MELLHETVPLPLELEDDKSLCGRAHAIRCGHPATNAVVLVVGDIRERVEMYGLLRGQS